MAPAAAPLRGIDVSGWQGVIDWPAVVRAPQAPAFAFAKCTEGAGYADPTFAANWAALRGAGFALRGAYHFADLGDPLAEADWFLARLGALDVGEAPILDIERGAGDQSAWCLAWLARVEQATGVTPLLYTDWSYGATQLTDPALARYPLWCASYPPDPTDLSQCPASCGVWPTVTIWQHTDRARYPGIATPVDESVVWRTRAELAALGKHASSLVVRIGGALKSQPNHTCAPAIDPRHQHVYLAPGQRVRPTGQTAHTDDTWTEVWLPGTMVHGWYPTTALAPASA